MQAVKIRTLIQGRDVHSDNAQTRVKGIEEDDDGKTWVEKEFFNRLVRLAIMGFIAPFCIIIFTNLRRSDSISGIAGPSLVR